MEADVDELTPSATANTGTGVRAESRSLRRRAIVSIAESISAIGVIVCGAATAAVTGDRGVTSALEVSVRFVAACCSGEPEDGEPTRGGVNSRVGSTIPPDNACSEPASDDAVGDSAIFSSACKWEGRLCVSEPSLSSIVQRASAETSAGSPWADGALRTEWSADSAGNLRHGAVSTDATIDFRFRRELAVLPWNRCAAEDTELPSATTSGGSEMSVELWTRVCDCRFRLPFSTAS